jgi:hypothetical protein
MAKDKSILLVANARPFEIGRFYFFRDCRMRRFMEQTGTSPVYPPALRPWTETSAWLDAHSKLALATMAAQGDSETTLAVAASEGSALESRPGTSARESAQKARAAIDPEISNAVAAAGPPTLSDAGDKMGSALNDLAGIAEKIRRALLLPGIRAFGCISALLGYAGTKGEQMI